MLGRLHKELWSYLRVKSDGQHGCGHQQGHEGKRLPGHVNVSFSVAAEANGNKKQGEMERAASRRLLCRVLWMAGTKIALRIQHLAWWLLQVQLIP